MSHLIFTLDFHEMVRGTLKENTTCTVNYDPLRLSGGRSDYKHGSPDFEFTAHLQFDTGATEDVKLTSDMGILEEAAVRTDGLGSMLTGDFKIPAGTSEITVWISMIEPDGTVSYDSDFGKNFHFRLTDQDVQIKESKVSSDKKTGEAKFTLKAKSTPAVERIVVRYRITNGNEPFTEICVDLKRTDKAAVKQLSWQAEESVPFGSVVVFDLIYYVGAEKFKIENNGNYYIAD